MAMTTNSFRADLHCHTTASDGSESAETVMQLAKQAGLSALSITDHDTVAAYETAIPAAQQHGILLLPGIEFSTILQGTSVHILGYGFRLDHPAILSLCAKHAERRKNRNLAMLERLDRLGMSLNYEDLTNAIPVELASIGRSIGRPHIAFALVKKGYVETLQAAFEQYIGEGRPCFVQGDSFSVDETIDVIHQAKGIAVIAHPHLIKKTELLNELLKKNFDGIECFYGKFPGAAYERWLKIAKYKNWLVTGGSDFHGKAKPNQQLGCSWIGQEPFQAILDSLPKHS